MHAVVNFHRAELGDDIALFDVGRSGWRTGLDLDHASFIPRTVDREADGVGVTILVGKHLGKRISDVIGSNVTGYIVGCPDFHMHVGNLLSPVIKNRPSRVTRPDVCTGNLDLRSSATGRFVDNPIGNRVPPPGWITDDDRRFALGHFFAMPETDRRQLAFWVDLQDCCIVTATGTCQHFVGVGSAVGKNCLLALSRCGNMFTSQDIPVLMQDGSRSVRNPLALSIPTTNLKIDGTWRAVFD